MNTTRTRRFLSAALAILTGFCLVSLLAPASGAGAQNAPLTVPGKKTIFQRVITHPGAESFNDTSARSGDPLRPFSALYVYEAISIDGVDWLRVSSNTGGRGTAWVKKSLTSEWNKALVLLVSPPARRRPLMFFKSRDDLLAVGSEPSVSDALTRLEAEFKRYLRAGEPAPSDFPVVSLEPPYSAGSIPYDHFYLMPVFDYDDVTFDSVKLLQVASVDPGYGDGSGPSAGPRGGSGLFAELRAGGGSGPPRDGGTPGPQAGPAPAPPPGGASGGGILSEFRALRAARAAEEAARGGTGGQAAPVSPEGQLAPENAVAPKVGVAFVIDTSISMGRYIEGSLQFARDFYDDMAKEMLPENTGLAVVAFRNSLDFAPGLEYTSRVVADFVTASDRAAFEDALGGVREAAASSHSFSEDSFAGILTAVNELDWYSYDGRILVLISDAGPLPETDSLRSTDLGPADVGETLKAKNIKFVAVHLKTPAGQANHRQAETAYRALSLAAAGEDYYVDIVPTEGGQAGEVTFGTAARMLMRNITMITLDDASDDVPALAALDDALDDAPASDGAAAAGAPTAGKPPIESLDYLMDQVSEEAEQSRRLRAGEGAVVDSSLPASDDPAVLRASRIGNMLGNSIMLEYLGGFNQVRAPSVVRSWIPDKDLSLLDGEEGLEVPTVEVAVLVSKNQLSTLSGHLRVVLEQADRSLDTQSRDFFQSVIDASAQISTDPNQFVLTPNTKLSELGLLAEFLSDLPYKSQIMGMTESDWYNMSAMEQDAFVRRLRSKLLTYDNYDKDTANWANFDEADPGEWLFRVPLSQLP
ncbi:MAG: VWA domain-containing protein [Deltaproteobacteria bacterium]|jgi:serine/threonine-protein kinase PpkA|nr:VWA domain-containing protein [Deltaproteobacteria bacterium]